MLRQRYREGVLYAWSIYEKYILQQLRYRTITFYSMYRHKKSVQILTFAFGSFCTSWFFFNVRAIQTHERNHFNQFFPTQYSLLVRQILNDDRQGQAYKIVLDLINKSKKTQLSNIEILALSELVKKPELNLHAQYIASLK